MEVFADRFKSEDLCDFVECFCLLPGLFELLLGVFSFVPVDWFGHGGVFLGLGFCLIVACCFVWRVFI